MERQVKDGLPAVSFPASDVKQVTSGAVLFESAEERSPFIFVPSPED